MLPTRDASHRRHVSRRIRAVIDSGGPTIVFQPIVRAVDGATIVFQPIVRAVDGAIEGYEALSRFPEGGGTTERWFADAVCCGLGAALDTSAVMNALKESAQLPHGSFLAVNLCAATLLADFSLVGHLVEFGQKRHLIVEITEHATIDDEVGVLAVLAELRRGGVDIAVDDVGSGYAGLRHLVLLEPDVIKLDAFVVHGMRENRIKMVVAELILEFARKTGARCVFEGIETDDDLEVATSIGADLLQGYRLGRPAAMHQFTRD
ncbi:EAL domain-containing protein [Rhodococcus sp. SBT000017]|uniref:EAL domain-containing protein n=1 Tax=Rhodococcus sp. SBT000017 TaxID=1803385 RepID=UPI000EF894AF|nr:EAL domain-containing protein [Rhodococcus sp. SBT000017]RMB77416.1 EAL domain-containing protein [Rhodococcus sp. SBT000017]